MKELCNEIDLIAVKELKSFVETTETLVITVEQVFCDEVGLQCDINPGDFLSTYGSTTNLRYLTDKFNSTQMDKIYVMWDCKRQVFHKEEFKLTPENLLYRGVINKNTIIVQAGLNCFKLLLRWKNHKGGVASGLANKYGIVF